MRIVFDTVILVRGLINPRSISGRLVFDLVGAYEVIVSASIVSEYLDVIGRPEIARKYRGGDRDRHDIVDLIARALVVEPEEVPAICRDPADDKFLAAAKSGNADFIVTADRDLLDLVSYEKIQIVSAEAFLRTLDTLRHREDHRGAP